MEHYQDDTRFLLLDSRSVPLAHGKLESAVDAPALQMLVLNGKADEVARHEIIQNRRNEKRQAGDSVSGAPAAGRADHFRTRSRSLVRIFREICGCRSNLRLYLPD